MSLQREVIQPDVLEERVVSTVIKHLSLSYIVQQLPTTEHQMSEELSLLQSVLQEVYKRLDALIRQLQVNVNVKRLDALIRQLQVNVSGIVMIEYLVISHTKESSEQLEDIQG